MIDYLRSELSLFFIRQGAHLAFIIYASLRKQAIFLWPMKIPRRQFDAIITDQILSTWNKAISATDRKIDRRQPQKKALMHQLLTGIRRVVLDAHQEGAEVALA